VQQPNQQKIQHFFVHFDLQEFEVNFRNLGMFKSPRLEFHVLYNDIFFERQFGAF